MRTLYFTLVLALRVGVASAAAATSPPQNTTTAHLLRVRRPLITRRPLMRAARTRSSHRIATCRAPSTCHRSDLVSEMSARPCITGLKGEFASVETASYRGADEGRHAMQARPLTAAALARRLRRGKKHTS